jgi:hypothetical protein
VASNISHICETLPEEKLSQSVFNEVERQPRNPFTTHYPLPQQTSAFATVQASLRHSIRNFLPWKHHQQQSRLAVHHFQPTTPGLQPPSHTPKLPPTTQMRRSAHTNHDRTSSEDPTPPAISPSTKEMQLIPFVLVMTMSILFIYIIRRTLCRYPAVPLVHRLCSSSHHHLSRRFLQHPAPPKQLTTISGLSDASIDRERYRKRGKWHVRGVSVMSTITERSVEGVRTPECERQGGG